MKEALLVFIGGGLGSVARFAVGRALATFSVTLPLATFTVNVLGCFLMGSIVAIAARQESPLPPAGALLLTTGFCGGFTTFSSFILEEHGLLVQQPILAIAYLTSSLAIGLAAVQFGFYLFRV